MGFRDKLIARQMAKMPDYKTILTESLGDDGPYLAHAFVIPSAYERGGGPGGDVFRRLLSAAVDAGINAVSGKRHIGGEEGSIARSLPRDGQILALAVSPSHLTWWDFGPMMKSDAPTLRMRLSRSSVATFEDTGKKAQGGVAVACVTFADGSFFDYRMAILSGPEFWDEVAAPTR